MLNQGARHFVAGIIAASVGVILASATAHAQATAAETACITAFNKGIRQVAKAQAGIINKCLRDFASGRLTGSTPEDCVRSDLNGDQSEAIAKAGAKIAAKCSAGIPGYGATPVETALLRAALAQIDLAHGIFGADLDNAIVPIADRASCQARVNQALLKCEDRRIREYLKCQKTGLKNGAITDAASMADTCLGTGASSQPDPKGRIALDCDTKLAKAVSSRCGDLDLTAAFPACYASTATGTTDCLKRESACQLCQLLNDVDNLSRDCDLFDDGIGSNGSCGSECADGVLQADEACDDGNALELDGCSSFCTVEGGWTCSGEPSSCSLLCGNGEVDAGELCDDGDTQNGDGCSAGCLVESGYHCSGEPSVCALDCGDGVLQAGEACDDGDQSSGDGCSASCQIEGGYTCAGAPSVCTFVCGNGSFQAGETCDDNNAANGDGCSHTCQIESGWLCAGLPSICTPQCGDGQKKGGETCDDGNTLSGDGCSFLCQTEPGYTCTGAPSNCLAVCGDGFIRGFENCDDGNNSNGDGCSGTFCRQEASFECLGQPSVCAANCGDGNLDAPELCDDGNNSNSDGCSATCLIETGYACSGQPSVCASTCGNGVLNAGEQCDDGNSVSRDGCSNGCKNESGWLCTAPGTPCAQFEVVIDTPANGIFTTAGSVTVTGHYTLLPNGTASVLVNGVPASSLNQTNRTFSHSVPVSQSLIFNPVNVTLINTVNGDDVHDRITIIGGPSVADGVHSPQSVALRLNDTGLDAIEPLVADLAGAGLNLGALMPVGTVLADSCFVEVIGCWGSAVVRIANPAPSLSGISLAIDSKVNLVQGDIRVFNLRVDIDIDGSGVVPDCGLRLTANVMLLSGNYTLEPDAVDQSNIDVNLSGGTTVSFGGFNRTFTSGLCDAPIIGDIIQSFLPDIEAFARDGIQGFLADPDGGGPADSPIAQAIEDVLAGISITGPVGAGLGLMLDSPLFAVTEDNTGITLGSNARFQVSVGSGPGQCIPPPGTPNLTASLARAATFPTYGANAPVSGQPYGLAIGISSAGFNQLLRGQTECGLMRSSMTTIDLDGEGGQPALPITSSLLSLIVPEFAQLPANTPLRIDIAPTIAPVVTGAAGPAGELTELKVAQVILNIVEPGSETVWLRGALDTRLGFNMSFLPDGSGLAMTISEPPPADIVIAVIDNLIGASESQVETVLPALIRPLIPQLAGALAGFPLPQFFGLTLQGVEVSRNGQFLSLFANLAPAP